MSETSFDELYSQVVGDDEEVDYGPDELTPEELAAADDDGSQGPDNEEITLTPEQEAERAKQALEDAERIRGEQLGLLTVDDVRKYLGDRRTVAMHEGQLSVTEARKAADALLKRDDIPGPIRVTLEAQRSDLELALDEGNELLTEAALGVAALSSRIAATDIASLPPDPLATVTWSTGPEGESVKTTRDQHGRESREVFAPADDQDVFEMGQRLAAEERGETGLLSRVQTYEDARNVTKAQLLAASNEELEAFEEAFPDVVQAFLDEESEALDRQAHAQGYR